MSSRVPPRLPKDVITLLTVLLVIVLVSFPATSSQVVVLICVGGGVFLLLSRTWQKTAEAQVSSASALQSAYLAQLAAQQAQKQTQREAEPVKERTRTDDTPTPNQDATANVARKGQQTLYDGDRFSPPPTRTSPELEEGKAGRPSTSKAPAQLPGEAAAAKSGSNSSIPLKTGGSQAMGQPLAGGAAVLARLRQQRAQGDKLAAEAAKREADTKAVVIAYASQTGTAQEIAKGIQAESAAHGIKSKVMSLNELGFERAASGDVPALVIIAASTGDGDAPDNAAVFYTKLRRKTQPAGILKGVKFTCLGLGDSNYTRFMGVSRALRSRLQELGAEPFHRMGEADEVDGLETTVDPWIADLWDPLTHAIGKKESKGSQEAPNPPAEVRGLQNGVAADSTPSAELVGVPALLACRISLKWLENVAETTGNGHIEEPLAESGRSTDGEYSPEAPFLARVTAASYLTASTSDRKVLHLELDLADSGISYRPGDSLGVSPLNDGVTVDALLARLELDGQRVFEVIPAEDGSQQGLLPHLRCPCTIRRAFTAGVDVTSPPRKSLLRLLAEHCSDSKEQRALLHLSSRGGRDEYNLLLKPHSPSLLDLLRRFKSCRPPLAALLDALPPLAPRLYSVSSSPLEHPGRAHVAFSIVRIGDPSPNLALARPEPDMGSQEAAASVNRWGVATGWLERKVEPLLAGHRDTEVYIPVHLRRGGSFGLPEDLSSPLIMIGPGTGVTPFRGFLEHRRQLLKAHAATTGAALLYFGCRSPSEDFLYRSDLEGFESDGTLSRLEVTFSRVGSEKVYVQHRMKQQAHELYSLLTEPKAHVFVCGDGAKMAKDVHAALTEILEQQGNMTAAAAKDFLLSMTRAGRYIKDIWS